MTERWPGLEIIVIGADPARVFDFARKYALEMNWPAEELHIQACVILGPPGPATVVPAWWEVVTAGGRVRAGPELHVYTAPDPDQIYMQAGVQLVLTDRRALDVFAVQQVNGEAWFKVLRTPVMWVRATECGPLE